MPFAQWPEADRQMWTDLMALSGPLDSGGQLAHLRETSRTPLQNHYGRWLKWLAVSDPASLDEMPVRRASIDRWRSWLKALSHTRPMTQWSFVHDTVRLLRAAHPNANWRDHKQLVKHLRRQAGQGDRTRKAGRVLGSHVLLQAGLRHAIDGAEDAPTEIDALKRQRDGTMVAFLALMPIRRRAVVSLTIGTSILFGADGIEIVLSEDLTKTGVPWEAQVPQEIEPLMRRYADDTRPRLMAARKETHDWLWVNDRGAPYHLNYFGNRIGRITQDLLGVRVTPHLFRDAAATTLSRHSPDAAKLIPPVLSHSSNLTSQKHYIHAGSIEAGRGLMDVINQLKTSKAEFNQ
ncbi:tyrosine-type recombinase/integrase [Marivita hallyeonensis]|uniref:tyrosine-type recombinase/integrase n=1 Tax=Marivita hallyeonensis TaxID=996342 RepID=UPI001C4A4024|nr:hypothetical protein [Marivita hallyeonensis]